MHFFHRVAYCFLLVLLAVHVPAHPAKDILKPAHTIWPPEDHDENVTPHGKSKITWDCRWRYKFLWYEVDLSGHNWGKSEAAIKLAVQEAAHEAMTKWKYTEFKGEGLDEFDANFRMPIVTLSKGKKPRNLEITLNRLIGRQNQVGLDQKIQCNGE